MKKLASFSRKKSITNFDLDAAVRLLNRVDPEACTRILKRYRALGGRDILKSNDFGFLAFSITAEEDFQENLGGKKADRIRAHIKPLRRTLEDSIDVA